LGLVPDSIVLPHWSDDRLDQATRLLHQLPEGTVALGLPEQSGLLVDENQVIALGHTACALIGRRQKSLEPWSSGSLSES